VDLVLVVDIELCAENVVPCGVDLIGVGLDRWVGVDGAEFAVPEGGFESIHDLGFLEELELERILLVLRASVGFSFREPEHPY
jgi:hypothetical protein